MTQTPLQELIARFEKIGNKETDETKKWIWSAASEHLKLSLPKEKEFVGKCFEAGVNYMFSENGTYPNQKEFINQLYPEK